MLIFADTEFTGLDQHSPSLIAIGLVTEDKQTFYAELPQATYINTASPWVRENVLPLLDAGEAVMQPDELRQRLAAWLGRLGAVRIACDSKDYDFAFLRDILTPWPTNLAPTPLTLQFNVDRGTRFANAVEKAFSTGKLRQHHALDDAKANRLGWLAAQD